MQEGEMVAMAMKKGAGQRAKTRVTEADTKKAQEAKKKSGGKILLFPTWIGNK